MIGIERLEGEIANIACRLKELEFQAADNNKLLRDILRKLSAAPARQPSWWAVRWVAQ